MKILHVVALITPDGSYGGPQRVTCSLSSILHDRGHDVVVAGGHIGFDHPPLELGGAQAQLFAARRAIPGFGYAATVAPRMWSWISANASRFDIAHIHLSRDLVTIPAAVQLRKSGVPYVVQTHGMITPGSHPLAPPIDRLWTGRLLRSASSVLDLNDEEREALREVGGQGLRLTRLRNGVPVACESPREGIGKSLPEILFLARLHERKRPEVFAEAALMLLRRGIRARFAIVGPPEGSEASVDAVIDVARSEGFTDEFIRREPAVAPDDVGARMAKSSIYVLPAAREPFGLTIVEALAQGVPVVICEDGGLAPFVRRHQCGVVVEGSAESFANAISDLLADPVLADKLGQQGRAAVRSELSLDDVGRELEELYLSILGRESR